MNKDTAELVHVAEELTGEEALRRGLVPVPPEDLERVMAMSEPERLAWAAEQHVKTALPDGVLKVQPVGSLMKRGLEARAARNRAKRERRSRRGR